MKVVLFCGGLGLRMREASPRIPKPMVPIGSQPILWHIMKYYAHYGHKDFVLCLGHKANVIKEYFLSYNEALVNDVVWEGDGSVHVLKSDVTDWRITFLDTGLRASIGERLRAASEHLQDDELFFANYGDGLTDAPLPDLVANLEDRKKIGSFLCVRPQGYSFHLVKFGDDGLAQEFEDVQRSDLWINGGYFVFRREIFDYLGEGEDLVPHAFTRLMAEGQLLAYPYEGFWAPMDTLKERDALEAMLERGDAPWRVWENKTRPNRALRQVS